MEIYSNNEIDNEILEETDKDFKKILENMKDINNLIEIMHNETVDQGENINKIEENTEDVIEYIEEGSKELVLAKIYDKINKKKLMAIGGGVITGGIVGTCVGGFFGIIPGMVIGSIGVGIGAGTGVAVNKFKLK